MSPKNILILKNVLRKLAASRSALMVTSTVLGGGVLYMSVLVCQGATALERTAAQTAVTPKVAVHTPAPAPKPAAPVTTPAPAAAAPPAAKPPAAKPAPKRTAAARPAPVVTPSPGSSVDSLVPTTPAPAASGSGATTTTGYTSTNWSGYLMANASFTTVSGSWTATRPTGIAGTISADSSWIGIGGVSTNDLIQAGTQNIITAAGQIQTSAFYEILPAVSQPIASMTVSPGDAMSATISQTSPEQWTISITDNSTGQNFTTSIAYASSLSSAEWIEEDPSFSNNHQIPFDNFGLATFANSLTTENGTSLNLAGGNAQPITMVNRSGQTIAQPSAIGSDGASFRVTP